MASIQHDSEDFFRHEHYLIFRDKILGSGSFSIVYEGFDNLKNRQIAVKHITNSTEKLTAREIEILKGLTEHDNIIRFYDSFVRAGRSWVVMQFCKGETLEKVMEEKCPKMNIRLDFIYQLIDGLQYMHDHSTAHRDLKPANVIIVRDTLVKICDFGLARFINLENTMNASTNVGTFNYMAPEFFNFVGQLVYDAFKVDIFATGLIILGTITCTKQQKMNHHFAAVSIGQKGKRILQEKLKTLENEYECQMTKKLIKLVIHMTTFEPSDRPNINDVFRHFLQIKESGKCQKHLRSEDRDYNPGTGSHLRNNILWNEFNIYIYLTPTT